MLLQRKSSPRLKQFDYYGSYTYFLTCSTYRKSSYFNEKEIVDMVLPVLKKSGDNNYFSIYIYCFMPDHLHLLLVGNEQSSLKKCMRDFKQESSYLFRKIYSKSLWQRSYYDHIVRKEDSIKEMVLYILNNPVRIGLVNSYTEYKYSGSFVFDIKELGGQA